MVHCAHLLARKRDGRRVTSRLPALLDYVLIRPIVSAGMIAAELGITPRAAHDLVAELGLRETTRSGRYEPGNSLKFPLSDCDVQTGRARRGNARLGAHMTQQLRSLENGARKRGGAMKQLEGALSVPAKRRMRTAWPKG